MIVPCLDIKKKDRTKEICKPIIVDIDQSDSNEDNPKQSSCN